MTNKIIKSVKVIKDLPGTKAPHELTVETDGRWTCKHKYNDDSTIVTYILPLEIMENPDFFEVTYEPEIKPVRYYPNGAVFDEPEANAVGWFINQDGMFYRRYFEPSSNMFQYILENQNWFITLEACEKWIDVINTHNRLLRTIMEIDAEFEWVVDWSNENQQKFSLYWNYQYKKIEYEISHNYRHAIFHMSRQAYTYMMSDAVSESDLKKFLLIID